MPTSTTVPAIYARLEAKAGKEAEVADFLRSAVGLVNEESGTTTWFALQFGPSSFGIFDTFADETGRQAHLNGKVAAALMARAEELFSEAPHIAQIDVFATKLPK